MSVGDDQKENESSENSSLFNSPPLVLNFPELTIDQFGICAQSFATSETPKGERLWVLLL